MPRRRAVIWVVAAALARPLPSAADGLADYLWSKRPILIFATPGDPRLGEQLARFERAAPQLVDRDNVILVDTHEGSALRAGFRPGEFTVILVGLDGGEKFRRDGLVEPADLNAFIDTMPMRRRELRDRDQTCAPPKFGTWPKFPVSSSARTRCKRFG